MNKLVWSILICTSLVVGCSLIIEEDISNEQLMILTPNDQDTLQPGSVVFWWEKLPDATHYELQLVSVSFDEIDEVLIDSLTTLNRLSFALDSGAYQWRLRAVNGSYHTSYTIRDLWVLPEETN